MEVLIILVIGMVLWVLIYKWYKSFMKKMAIKELKEQIVSLEFIAKNSDDGDEIQRCLEMAAKCKEALNKLEQ